MIKGRTICCGMMVLLAFASTLAAQKDNEARFSVCIYQGLRPEASQEQKGQILSGTYRQIDIQEVMTKTSMSKERERLLRIFNLESVLILGHGKLDAVSDGVHRADIVCRTSEIMELELQSSGSRDQYSLTVKRKGSVDPLMTSLMVIPPGQSAIVGFSAPDETLLFISIHMEKGDRPVLLHRVPPAYPSDLAKKGVSGEVILEFVIDHEGIPGEINAIDGPSALYPAAIEALKQWRYRPFQKGGRDLKVSATVIFNFRLKKEKTEK